MRINPPTLFWILIAAILAAYLFLPLERFDRPWLPWAGGALAVLGIAISVAGKMRFQRAGTNVYTFEEPDKLVTDGLYAVSRNPMYLGLVLAGFGAALASATAAALILATAFALTVRYWYIAYEEEVMQRRFGAEYLAYCERVRRWSGRRSQYQPAPRPVRPD